MSHIPTDVAKAIAVKSNKYTTRRILTGDYVFAFEIVMLLCSTLVY